MITTPAWNRSEHGQCLPRRRGPFTEIAPTHVPTAKAILTKVPAANAVPAEAAPVKVSSAEDLADGVIPSAEGLLTKAVPAKVPTVKAAAPEAISAVDVSAAIVALSEVFPAAGVLLTEVVPANVPTAKAIPAQFPTAKAEPNDKVVTAETAPVNVSAAEVLTAGGSRQGHPCR